MSLGQFGTLITHYRRHSAQLKLCLPFSMLFFGFRGDFTWARGATQVDLSSGRGGGRIKSVARGDMIKQEMTGGKCERRGLYCQSQRDQH